VARRADMAVELVHGDMRELTFDAAFDAVYCFGASFGFFEEEANRAVLAHACRALKPGGRFLVDLINRDYVIGELPKRVWWQGTGCMVLEEVDFNYYSSRLQNHRSVVFEDGRQLEYDISIRTYSLHEIGKLLHQSGFRVIEVSGGLFQKGRFFGAESRQLLIVAEKK
jgi:SAM-dependent methyltransferase